MVQDSASLPTRKQPTYDTPSADELWRLFAPAIAGEARVRVARDWRQYRRGWEQNLDPARRPARPAAVRIYDVHGETRCVVFDLDAKKAASKTAVRRDCERLTGWLGEAGCSYVVDESPTGGRHVYVPLDHTRSHTELAPLVRHLRTCGALPTLDPSPMANRTEGCIRPPGAVHRAGGHQRLVTSFPKALSALASRTTAAAWQAFTLQLPPVPRTAPDKPPPAGEQWTGQPVERRPLDPVYAQVATVGEYDAERYATPSQARAAVLLHALNRGWTAADITREVEAGRWGGLQQLYTSKYGCSYATKAFAGDLARAEAKRDEQPLQKSHTSATRPRGGAASAHRALLRQWTSAITLALESKRWTIRQSYGLQLVLVALGDASRRSQSVYTAFGVRHLSMGAGTVLDWATVAAALRQLRAEDDPFILLVDSDRGAGADIYELRVPDAYLEDLPDEAALPEPPRGVHPAFSQLSLPAYRIHTVLQNAAGQLTVREIAAAAFVPVRTVYATLQELLGHKLVRRGLGGRWRLGRRTLDQLARKCGVGRRLVDLVRTWRLERNAWRAVLSLPTRDYRPLRAVSWPGCAAYVAPTLSSVPPPKPPPPELGEDEDEWGALAVLKDMLGAEVMHVSRPRLTAAS